MNTIEKADERIKTYEVLQERADALKIPAKNGMISPAVAIYLLADIVDMMLRVEVKEAKETKEMLQSIKDGSHLAGI